MLPSKHDPLDRGIRRGRWYRAVKGSFTVDCYDRRIIAFIEASLCRGEGVYTAAGGVVKVLGVMDVWKFGHSRGQELGLV